MVIFKTQKPAIDKPKIKEQIGLCATLSEALIQRRKALDGPFPVAQKWFDDAFVNPELSGYLGRPEVSCHDTHHFINTVRNAFDAHKKELEALLNFDRPQNGGSITIGLFLAALNFFTRKSYYAKIAELNARYSDAQALQSTFNMFNSTLLRLESQ